MPPKKQATLFDMMGKGGKDASSSKTAAPKAAKAAHKQESAKEPQKEPAQPPKKDQAQKTEPTKAAAKGKSAKEPTPIETPSKRATTEKKDAVSVSPAKETTASTTSKEQPRIELGKIEISTKLSTDALIKNLEVSLCVSHQYACVVT